MGSLTTHSPDSPHMFRNVFLQEHCKLFDRIKLKLLFGHIIIIICACKCILFKIPTGLPVKLLEKYPAQQCYCSCVTALLYAHTQQKTLPSCKLLSLSLYSRIPVLHHLIKTCFSHLNRHAELCRHLTAHLGPCLWQHILKFTNSQGFDSQTIRLQRTTWMFSAFTPISHLICT